MYSICSSKWAVGRPSVMSMICRFGVSCVASNRRGERQAVLDVREVRRHLMLADVLAAHVGLQPHDRVEHRHRLRHQARRSRPGSTSLANVYISMNCK